MSPTLRLALDQNFPLPLLVAMRDWLPAGVDLKHVKEIDKRLCVASDRELIIALSQLGYDGLVTNNYKMLFVPHEVAAIIATKAVVIALEKMGDSPIRPAGALMLELPDLERRLLPNQPNVIRLHYTHRRPTNGWDCLQHAAGQRHDGVTADDLWTLNRPTEEELAQPILP